MRAVSLTERAKTLGLCGMAAVGLIISPFTNLGFAGTFNEQSQVEVGGPKYFVQGEITKIAEGQYWIQGPDGEKSRLRVTKNTHMVCPDRAVSHQQPVEDPKAAGFRIGDCPFKVGDAVKAEVTDIGTATFIRDWPADKGTLTESLGLPTHYAVLPIWPVSMTQVRQVEAYKVQAKDGEDIGHLKKVILDNTTGDIEYGIVELENGSLMPVPYRAMQVSDKAQTARLQLSMDHLVYAPTFKSRVSIKDMRAFWERAYGDAWEPNLQRPYEAQWVKNVVDSFTNRVSFRDTFARYPDQPDRVITILDRAAKKLNQGREAEAREYFARALFALDEAADEGYFSEPTAHRLRAIVVLHAPARLAAVVRDGDPEPSIGMEEAIRIARYQHPGKVINADYMGEQGLNVYRIKIMSGKGITRQIELSGATGEVQKNAVVAGHAMPNEGFR